MVRRSLPAQRPSPARGIFLAAMQTSTLVRISPWHQARIFLSRMGQPPRPSRLWIFMLICMIPSRTVHGYADPGVKVGVNVWIDNGYQDVWADDTTGSWQASYVTSSGPFIPWTGGDVTTWDEDGDVTVYRINNGNIFATPEADYIELQNVTKYRMYTLTINDPADGLFYTDTRQSQLGEGETHGDVIFPLSDFALDAGDQITIASGHDVRSLVVAPKGTISFGILSTISSQELTNTRIG